MESFAVLVRDESFRELQRGQNGAAMGRIGNARMMQACDEVADLQLALCLLVQREAAAAVDPLVRDLIAVPHSIDATALNQCADGPGHVTHVVTADAVMLV